MFDLRGVTKRFAEHTALYPIEWKPECGKVHALIGPSGCGKTTLLRAMLLLVEPDSGSIRFDGTIVRPQNVISIRRRIGYVIQQGGLFPHLTAKDNVVLVARHLNWSEKNVEDRVARLLELAQLDAELLDRFPAQLSGGQQQRVSLMRALMLDPDALLLDEPLGALDPMIRAELQQDLRNIFRQLGKTVILVTHDLAEASFFADSITLMRDGRVVQQGAFPDLVDHPTEPFVSAFVSAQQTGWLEGGS